MSAKHVSPRYALGRSARMRHGAGGTGARGDLQLPWNCERAGPLASLAPDDSAIIYHDGGSTMQMEPDGSNVTRTNRHGARPSRRIF